MRRFPSSRRFPHFNAPELEAILREAGVGYRHFAALGGRRSPAPDSPNAGWRVGQFRGYADHMRSEEFERALTELLVIASGRRIAVMCAEAVWWRCHRRLLSDALLVRGAEVGHVDPSGRIEAHVLTPFAAVEDGRLGYPQEQGRLEV